MGKSKGLKRDIESVMTVNERHGVLVKLTGPLIRDNFQWLPLSNMKTAESVVKELVNKCKRELEFVLELNKQANNVREPIMDEKPEEIIHQFEVKGVRIMEMKFKGEKYQFRLSKEMSVLHPHTVISFYERLTDNKLKRKT